MTVTEISLYRNAAYRWKAPNRKYPRIHPWVTKNGKIIDEWDAKEVFKIVHEFVREGNACRVQFPEGFHSRDTDAQLEDFSSPGQKFTLAKNIKDRPCLVVKTAKSAKWDLNVSVEL